MPPASSTCLANVKVLDFTRVISGPFATMMLADMGADVVKVEEPQHGDEMRHIVYEGRSSHDHDYFNANNRSKRSIALNLKDPAHVAIAQELASKADIAIENFSPGVADRLGIGWSKLHAINPKLVYCSISGFGQTGPYRSRPALDPVIQAFSGVMSVTGNHDQPPLQIGAPVGDVVAGMFAAYAVVCAWSEASRTKVGRYIDVSMLDSMMAVLGPRMGEPLQAGKNPERHGNSNPMRIPTNAYLTADNRHIMVAVLNDVQWKPFCDALERTDWHANTTYRTMAGRRADRERLDALVAESIRLRTFTEWEKRFEQHRVPFGSVNSYLEAVNDPQVAHRGLIREVKHPRSGNIRVVGAPWKITGVENPVRSPPLLGEHTDEVLRDWLSQTPTALQSTKA